MENKDKKQGTFGPDVKSIADIPLPKQLNYETSQQLAWKALKSSDISERALAAGVQYDAEENSVIFQILGRQIEIRMAEGEVFFPDGKPSAPWETIIPLHYLCNAKGTNPTGKLITYKEIPDGRLYWPNFVARTHNIILKTFGAKPERILDVARAVGGESHDQADVSIRVKALPRVEIILQLWKGDEELSPEAAFLFDSSITDYLPTEDITVLSQMMSIKLMIAARS